MKLPPQNIPCNLNPYNESVYLKGQAWEGLFVKLRFLVFVVCLLFFSTRVSAQTPGQLPPLPQNTPKVGEKAPDFALPDKDGKSTKLSALLAEAGPKGQKGSWVLLIFYRGYW